MFPGESAARAASENEMGTAVLLGAILLALIAYYFRKFCIGVGEYLKGATDAV